MDDVVTALAAQQDELATLVVDRDEMALGRPSRCPGWSAGDVLLHLAQTNEMAVASLEDRFDQWLIDATDGLAPATGVDDGAAAMVAAQRSTGTNARDRWLRSAPAQVDAFRRIGPTTRVRWVAGELAARSLASTRLSECWIHTVDVAAAFGAEPSPTDRLWHVARLAWRTLPYAFSQDGVTPVGGVGFDLIAPDGTPWTFGMNDHPSTVVTGSAHELCTVAGQRADAADTGLRADGPDAAATLRLVRTFA